MRILSITSERASGEDWSLFCYLGLELVGDVIESRCLKEIFPEQGSLGESFSYGTEYEDPNPSGFFR